MKLFLASALVALSAKNASAFRIAQTRDDTYCVVVVPNDSTVWPAANLGTTPAAVKTDGDDGPTVGPNGVLDPNNDILAAAQGFWASGVFPASGLTVYEAGGTTALNPQPTAGATLLPATLTWCKLYSTSAPLHYCKGDAAYDTWQEANWGDTIDECCQNNHASEYNKCFETSAGVPPAANAANWFADHSNKVCNRVCDVDNLFQPSAITDLWTAFVGDVGGSAFQTYECGGLLSYTGQAVYTDAASCCADAYGDQNNDYCTFQSTDGLAPAPTPEYPGTLEWYGDSGLGICVPDCPDGKFLEPAGPTVVNAATTTTVPCGGIVKDAFTKLYADSAACCTGSALGSDAFTCEARSNAGDGEATDQYFAGSDGCYNDCTADPNCKTAPASSTLYATSLECCQKHFSWLKEEYCTTRAAPTFVTSAVSISTYLWYVDYQNGVCLQDCFADGTPAPSPLSTSSTPALNGPQCEYSTSGGLALGWYGTATDCCKNKLPSVDQDSCILASLSGEALDNTPTNKWYVTGNYDQPCAKDCAVITSDPECGGIKAKNGDAFYPDAATCCSTAFSWVDKDRCEALSADPDSFTDKWYVSYQDNTCHRDCDPAAPPAGGTAASCKGGPDDLSTPLYPDETTCCARMGWVDAATCAANSLAGTSSSSGAAGSGPGTGQWRKNDGYTQCVLDCKAGDTIVAGDPILALTPQPLDFTLTQPPWAAATLSAGGTYPDQCDGIAGSAGSWQTLYAGDLTSCCKSLPASVQEETCQALSLDIVSEMYFVSPSDRSTCVVHQEATASGGLIHCSSGKVVAGGSSANSVTGVTCNPTIDMNTKLYTTLDKCCEANVSWDKTSCVYKSQGASAPGTTDYYVDWELSQCVQNCPKANGPPCGGVANAWETLYATVSACTDRISWVAPANAVYTGR